MSDMKPEFRLIPEQLLMFLCAFLLKQLHVWLQTVCVEQQTVWPPLKTKTKTVMNQRGAADHRRSSLPSPRLQSKRIRLLYLSGRPDDLGLVKGQSRPSKRQNTTRPDHDFTRV